MPDQNVVFGWIELQTKGNVKERNKKVGVFVSPERK